MSVAVNSSPKQRLRLGHIHIDPMTFPEAIEEIARLVRDRRGGVVVTPNVDHVVLAEDDVRFRRAYETAQLCLADGMPLVWASRLLGARLPEKVSGSDLVLPLLQRAGRDGWRVFLLGGAPGVGERAAKRALERFPGLVIAGVSSPHIDIAAPAHTRAALIAEIAAAKADLVLVALGAPKQEIWMSEAAPALDGPVLVGVGASIDFLAGSMRRAPKWMSASGLEWLFRLGLEPRRLWRRYLVRDPKFLLILLRDIRGVRRQRGRPTPEPSDLRR